MDATMLEGIFRRQVKTAYRVCYSFMGNSADAEDAVQTTFLKLASSGKTFEDAEHEKAWIIVCASNVCRDILKSAAYRFRADEAPELLESNMNAKPASSSDESADVREAIMALPERYKDCVYLHYYEGYKTAEIAEMLQKPPSTIRNYLSEARALLKTALEGGTDGE